MKLKEKKLLETVSTKSLWWPIGFVSNNSDKGPLSRRTQDLKIIIVVVIVYFLSFDW